MSNPDLKNIYPSNQDIRVIRDSLPNGYGKIVQAKLKEKGEERSLDYIYNVMACRFKNVNVMAAIIEYRKELKEKLQIDPEQ